MTDTAEAGSVTPEASAGAPAVPNAPVDNGSTSETQNNPFAGLHDEGARKWVETKGYKTVDDVVGAAHSLEKKLGGAIDVPGADAPAEEWDKFYSRLPEQMRPVSSPDKLEFKLPEGLPEGLPYSDDLAVASKDWMTKAKLNPGQAQTMHDAFVGYMADQQKAALAGISESVENTHDALVKDWGAPESEGFKAEMAMADRAMKQLGLVDAFKGKGILLEDGALTEPQIARAFAEIGKAMFKEDTIETGGVRIGDNPFKGDNITEQSLLVKNDPERAKRLIRDAGKRLHDFFPTNPL
jgi:hypothetical protein